MTRPARTIRAAGAVLIAVAISLSAGCAGSGALTGEDALDRLASSAMRDARAKSAPPPPGAPDDLTHPPADPARSAMSLADALAAVTPALPDPAGPTPNPTAESIRLFISGRATRLSGDPAGAIAELQAAAQADPGAADPWRELAEAHRQQGDMLSAVAARRQALRLDPTDAESRLWVGLWALDRRDSAAAATDLALARAHAGDLLADAGAGFVLDVNLGRALSREGYLAAGAALLGVARELPERFDAPTRFPTELDAVYRGRADAVRDAGDGLARLGRFDEALALYLAADDLPALDPASFLPRVTFAAMRDGRPAVAARALLDALEHSTDLTGQRLLPLLRHVSEHSGVGDELARAVGELLERLGPDAPRQGRSLLIRAHAATLPPDRAARALRDWLAQRPDDTLALEDLFSLSSRGTADAVEQTLRLIESAPAHEARFAAALVESFGDVDAILAALTGRAEPGARVLRGRLLLDSGRPALAVEALAPAPTTGGVGAAAVTLRIEALARLAREADAEALLPALDSAPAGVAPLLRARALTALNRPAEALDQLRDALDPTGDAPLRGGPLELEASLLASSLAWVAGDADAVEHYAERALALDPAAEGAYARLIDLYRPGGPLAGGERLASAIRRLREANPSSRTLRWHRARELVAAGQYDRAERDLLSLAEEDPESGIVDLLVALWVRTGSVDRAEAWLRGQLERRPHDATMPRALARVLASDDRAEAALALLDAWLTDHPYDDATARQAEGLLRDTLGRVVEADERALARLADRPVTLARAIERSDILVRRNRSAEAAADLLAGLDDAGGELAPGLARGVLQAVALLSEVAIKADADLRDAALALLDRVRAGAGGLPIELHDARLNLLSLTGAPFDRLADALDEALASSPDRANELAAVAVGRLSALERAPIAARLAAHARSRLFDPDTRFFSAWMQAAFLSLDAASARQMVRAVAGANLAPDLLAALGQDGPTDGDRGNATLALSVADYFALNGATVEDAIDLYDLALEFDAAHELALNNYGYYLADRGLRLDEAERMIRRSLELEPTSGPTTDSLGWVLYKRGVIHDTVDETGAAVEGAVTVLRRAVAMPMNRTSAEVIDHLGDALWAAGERDQAVRRWLAAVSLLEETVRQVQRNPQSEQTQRLLEQFTADLARVRGKLDAPDTGAEPAIAPIVGPINAPAPPAGAPGGR